MTLSQRTILIASYHFPPDAAVGALRPARFAARLTHLGWRVSVLTVREGRHPTLDAGRMESLDGIETLRTYEPPSLLALANAAKGLVLRRGAAGHARQSGRAAERTGEKGSRETLWRRLKRYLLSLVAFVPDDRKKWAVLAAARAVWIIRRGKIGYLLTSGPPASVHFVGLAAKILCRVHWAADFRDPWIESVAHRSPRLRSRLGDAIERRLERLVITRADLVVTTNETFACELRGRYPELPAARFFTVMNSIDPEVTAVGEAEKYDRFTITYAGALYFRRTPEPLFHAVRELIDAGEIAPRDIRIKLVGECQYADGVETGTLIRQYGLEDVVEVLGTVPRVVALDIMRRSHLLLVLAPANHRLLVVAKVFDYLGSGSRILAIAEEGATKELIDRSGGGVCFRGSDIRGLVAYLGDLISTGGYRRLANDVGTFAAYGSVPAVTRLSERMSVLQQERQETAGHGR